MEEKNRATPPAAEQLGTLTETAQQQPHLYPPPEKTALENLLEGTFETPAQAVSENCINNVKAEISRYRSEATTPLKNSGGMTMVRSTHYFLHLQNTTSRHQQLQYQVNMSSQLLGTL